MLNTYVSKLVSFACDSLLGLKLSFDLYTSVILCIRMSSSIIHFFSSHHMHPFGNNCCRKKPFNLRAFKVGISGESRGGVPGDPQPLSLGLDDRPPAPPLSEGLDLPLAINDNSDVLSLISSGLTHPRKGF